jgi:hypothetical protein
MPFGHVGEDAQRGDGHLDIVLAVDDTHAHGRVFADIQKEIHDVGISA